MVAGLRSAKASRVVPGAEFWGHTGTRMIGAKYLSLVQRFLKPPTFHAVVVGKLRCSPRNSYVLLHVFVASITDSVLPYLQVAGLHSETRFLDSAPPSKTNPPGFLTQDHAKCKTSEALVSLRALVKFRRPGRPNSPGAAV